MIPAMTKPPWPAGRDIDVGDDLHLHVVEAGSGPLVVLCHGFPELGYSWRHQLAPLAAAGYRVAIPDMLGFGASSRPDDVRAYDAESVSQRLLALVEALGEREATFVGHDWGAGIAWYLAHAHPERVSAVVGMSVPFAPPAPAPPTEIFRRRLGEDFYIVWFQEPGVAEAALGADVRRTLTTPRVWTAAWAADTDEHPRLPQWMDEADLAVYVDAYSATGFSGGLGYYRNIDRNWELATALGDRRVDVPAMFLTGSRDPVARFMPTEPMRAWLTDLRAEHVIEGAGHWVQQQSPGDVNAALIEFLGSVL
jgi:pimeloyl-ACP methyl ester carboxylesterase